MSNCEHKINGKTVDIIEIFEDRVIVQEQDSKLIYTVYVDDFFEEKPVESNIVTIKGYSECKKREKTKNPQSFPRLKKSL